MNSVEHRTLNIEHRTSNGMRARVLQRSKFDVGCSMSSVSIVFFALLALLSLAPLSQAQTNRPSGTVGSWGLTD